MKFLKKHKNKFVLGGWIIGSIMLIKYVGRNGYLSKIPMVGGQLNQVAGLL